jgi:hypothetical protein
MLDVTTALPGTLPERGHTGHCDCCRIVTHFR